MTCTAQAGSRVPAQRDGSWIARPIAASAVTPFETATSGEIAKQLHVSVATVKSHVSSLLLKIGGRSRVDLVIASYEGRTPPG
ncbi:response regulator transcription factor [Occultella kanbiaonis]|uniref:response regulator transcription factor n=1 Tax=Occultella kanbiaonis TaxID=2675754 RepID=UPI0013D1EFDF|nr:helix-turn-helix transcriptional regulator [Occultella kanbiaonis]